MPGDITLTSTTNTEAEIREALGVEPAPPAAKVLPAAETPAPAAAAAPVDETPAEEAAEADDVDGNKPPVDPEVSEAASTLSKRKGRLQARLDDLTREKYDSQRAKDEALAEVAQLRARLEELERRKGEPAEVEDETEERQAAPPEEPVEETVDPNIPPKPIEDNFATYTEFIDALTDWKADRRDEARSKRDLEVQQQRQREAYEHTQRSEWEVKLAAAKVKHQDFDAVTQASATVPLSLPVRDMLLMSDHGAELLYYLATHPAEAVALSSMHPVKALSKLGRLEAQIESEMGLPAAAEEESREPTRVPVSRAPKPLPRVGGGGGTPFTKDPSTMDHAEFKAWREANIRAKSGR